MRERDTRSLPPLCAGLISAALLLGALRAQSGRIPFLGRLPGDLSIVIGRASFYLPFTSGILVAAAVTAFAVLISRLFTDNE
jgi:hypothetical protein